MVTGSGTVARETRPLGPWTAVALSCPARLEVSIGENQGIAIEADDNILPLIETVVENGQLTIRFRPEETSIRQASPIVVQVATPEINAMSVSGSGSIHASEIAGSELTLNVSGSGNLIALPIEVEQLATTISGSGTVATRGRATEQKIRISGSGDFDARDLASQRADVRLSGSGSAMVRVEETITGRIVGSGSLIYAGQPSVSVRTTGSGRAVQMPG